MKRNIINSVLLAALVASTCACSDFLDTRIDVFDTMDRLESRYSTLNSFAYAFYTPMQNGFNVIDGNLLASISDEAEQTAPTSDASAFTRGLISADLNPLSYLYNNCYEGIRAARFFLDYAKDGEKFLALNRDTSTVYNLDGTVYSTDQPRAYKRDVINLGWLRAEAGIAEAYYYGELIKMYGGVPIIGDDGKFARQATYDEVVEHIVDLIDANADKVNLDWRVALDETPQNAIADVTNWNFRDNIGRFDKTAALAVKARVLLYAASPRNNPDGDIDKWARAAAAANDVIQLRKAIFEKGFGFGEGARSHPSYHMPANRDYGNYFLKNNSTSDVESIFLIRQAAGSAPESANYPNATRGGNSGVCPTQNLVDAYEYIGEKTVDPYANRDPRFAATIVYNGSTWNGNVIDESPNAPYDQRRTGASKTGYYLRKFLAPNLNLIEGGSTDHIWPLYRYAEVLLNYAEAMNEAYGPDADPKAYGMTAREALTEVRNSASTSLPAVTATSKQDFRDAVKQERRIELAFEDHRYWDLLRWKDAEVVLNRSIKGVQVRKNNLGGFQYTYPTVAYRTFYERNYYLPFTRKEIANSAGTLTQNPDYN
ncbi:MAG: RagB/SusD family nutrient uptake outer membrane protein [Bacteroidales bacterium]|nr:RagB/SusD family nutrient uptake outer membrane protein [Bacteroidales bacterium]